MHQINVLILGPRSFIATRVELKSYLKFNLYEDLISINKKKINLDIAILHKDVLASYQKLDIFKNTNLIKILASDRFDKIDNFEGVLKLPSKLNEISSIVEQVAAKKIFNKNSSIIKIPYLQFADINYKDDWDIAKKLYRLKK